MPDITSAVPMPIAMPAPVALATSDQSFAVHVDMSAPFSVIFCATPTAKPTVPPASIERPTAARMAPVISPLPALSTPS